jgi:sulfofructosephosphate aldolase
MTGAMFDLQALADDQGLFTMLALDHRGALQSVMERDGARTVGADAIRPFKQVAIDELAPSASACLLDFDYGLNPDGTSPLPAGTALILAAQEPDRINGTPIGSTRFDSRVTPERVATSGAVALKLLVDWTPTGDREQISDFTQAFVELSKECGVLSLVEGVTWPSSWVDEDQRDDAILECARVLCATDPDIYKAEVAGFRGADLSSVTARSRELTDAIDCPWVVLSHGIAGSDFASAIEACCEGGASGFLAGQAVWGELAQGSLAADDLRRGFRTAGVERFRDLIDSARRGVGAYVAG